MTIWPMTLREQGDWHKLSKTAEVKQPLARMPGRECMATTYEHDFGYRTRPKSFGIDDSTEVARTLTPRRRPDSHGSLSNRSSTLGKIAGLSAAMLTPRASSAPRSARLSASAADPIPISVRGWSDICWHPKTHPHMVLGATARHLHVMQVANTVCARVKTCP